MAEDLAAIGQARGRAGAGPFVGRGRELAELRAALDAAGSGRGSVALLVGEPGIGKTSLARALADDAERRGARTVWGVSWPGGGAPAYWPWIQVARALLRSDETAEGAARGGEPSLAAILPELREAAGGASDLPPPATDEGRFRIYDALAELLRDASRRAPLVVVLDDLQWADEASLLTLAFVARALPDAGVLLLGTYRATELPQDGAGASPLTELVGWSRRIDLSGLDPADVRRLVDEAGRGATPDVLVERIHSVTMGNPLFVSELVSLLDAEGRLDDLPGASGIRLPAGVGEVIAHRLAPLPADALEALRVGSVIGPEFDLATLARAAGVPDDDLLAQLDAAVRNGVLAPVPDTPDRYAFSHELVQASLYDGLPAARRRALHRAVGEALEDLHGTGDDAPLTELAHHFLAAAPERDARAIAYARRAGDRAMAQFAYGQAAGLFARALAAGAPARGPERIELLQALGEAQTRAGDTGAARETLLEAAAAARLADEPEAFARAVLACGIWGLSFGVDEELVRLADEGITRLQGGGHDAQLARIKGLLATALYWSGDGARRFELCDEALALARALEQREPGRASDETVAYVLGRVLLARWGPAPGADQTRLEQELIERAQALGDVELELLARNWRISVLLETGDVVAADREIARVEHMAAKLRQPRAMAFLPLHHGMRAIASGDFEAAERLMAESAEIGRQVRGSVSELAATVQLVAIRLLQGRLPEVEAPIRALSDAHPGMAALRCALIALLVQADRPDEARAEIARVLAAGIPPDNTEIVSLALVADAVVELEEDAHVPELRSRLVPHAGRWVTSPGAATLWPVDRSLGRLSAALGDTDAALGHLAAARRQAERLGGRPAVALIALDEAVVLAARSGPGDAERVAALLGEAGRLGDALGMATVQRRVAALGSDAPAPVEPVATPADPTAGVLRREGDVWTLQLGDRIVRLRDAKGLRHLALLLSHPGEAFHASDVVAAGEGRAVGASPAARPDADHGLSIRAAGAGDAGPALDAEAKAAYRGRLEDLREELEEAEGFNDPERAARARAEYEFVAAELAGAVGLGGRDRRLGSDSERARVNATRAIRGTVQRVGTHDAALGRLLDRTIRTGTFCAYEPDPDRPVAWTVET